MRKYAFWLSLFLIFLMPWEGAFRIPGLGNATKLVGFGVGAFWVATVVFTNQIRKPGPFHLAVGLFVCWSALSVFWSNNAGRTVGQVGTWVQMLILVLLLWDLYTTKKAILAGLQAFVLGSYVAVGGAVANYLSGNPYYTNYERYSPGGTHPDGFGFILAFSVPVAWHLASNKYPAKWSVLAKFVNYAYIPVALLGLSLSGTRTALIISAFGMAFGIASLTRIRPWIRLAIIFPLLTVAILSLLPFVQTMKSFQRFGTISEELSEGDLNNRTNNWAEGYTNFLERPIKGVGSSMYRTVNSLGKVAHNTYVSILVELGLVGLTLFGIILAIAAIQAWHQPRWDAAFWFTMLVVWAVGATTLTWEDKKTTWIFLSLLVANAALTHRRSKAEPLVKHKEPDAHIISVKPGNELPGEKEKPYFV